MGALSIKSARKEIQTFLDRAFHYLVMAAIALTVLVPFVWMLSTSLKGSGVIHEIPPRWIPEVFFWNNYQEVLTKLDFLRYSLNSVYVSLMVGVGQIFACSLESVLESVPKMIFSDPKLA